MKENRYPTALLAALSIVPASAQMGTPRELPNIIYILADDLGIGDVGIYGQTKIATPAIDSLARGGMLFTQHYSGSTVSAPSRSSLMTGMHTGQTFVRGNKDTHNPDGNIYDHPLADQVVTVAEVLKQAGYATACIGKWGLGGPGTEGHPNRQGFDYFFGHLGQLNAHRHYPAFLHENSTLLSLNGEVYAQELCTQKALDFISKQTKEQPFFIYLTPTIPHADLDAEPDDLAQYLGRFEETPYHGDWYRSTDAPRATFAAMVSRMDRDIQRVVDQLQAQGLLENTIIIFSSDNGTHVEGGHEPAFFDSNGPFRGHKRDLYEGGIRTPLIVHWPKVIAPNSVSYHISAFWDFLPTICDLTLQALPEGVNGLSLLPTLTGEGEQPLHPYLYWEFHGGPKKQAVRAGEWKLVRLYQKGGTWKEELYNLYADPAEQVDVATHYPAVVARLVSYAEHAHQASPDFPFPLDQAHPN